MDASSAFASPAIPDLPLSLPLRGVRLLPGLGFAAMSGLFGVLLIGASPRAYLFIGAGVVIAALLLLLWRGGQLRLVEEGFFHPAWFGEHFVRWSDVLVFRPVGQRGVGWTYATWYRSGRVARAFNNALTGAEAALPEIEGMSAEELLALMQTMQGKYARRDWPGALPT